MAGFAYHTSFRNVGYTDLPEDDDVLSHCSSSNNHNNNANVGAPPSPPAHRIGVVGAADATAAARDAVGGDITLMTYDGGGHSHTTAPLRAGAQQPQTGGGPHRPHQRPSPHDAGLDIDCATDDSDNDGGDLGSTELDRMRAVLSQRVAHHAQRFHKDLKLTSDAVGLLDLLVGGIRLPSASESSYGGGGGIGGGGGGEDDENKKKPYAAAVVEEEEGSLAQLKAQLRQTNAVVDGMQLAMDVLRARAQLEQEARHSPSFKNKNTTRQNAAANNSNSNSNSDDDDKKQGLFHPWDRPAHRNVDATIAFACEALSDAGLARAQREAAATLTLIHDAPVGDVSRAIREANADVVASRAKEARLRADVDMLHRALAQADADAEGLGNLQATADPALFYLPQDASEWGPWAAEVASFGSSSPSAAATATPTAASSSRGGGGGTSLFLEDRVSVIDVAATLPEMKLWAAVCNDAFTLTLQRLAAVAETSAS